jgi:hypothetical protein
MEPVFTLPYPEYYVARELSKFFKKEEGYSILIPLSRQQKGFDLVILNQRTKKQLTVQVKSSRTYPGEASKRKTKRERRKHYTWFNKFEIDLGDSDYYILFGLYNKESKKIRLDHSRDVKKWYSAILLAFDENEMMDLLKSFDDTKFSFGFDTEDEILLTRGKKNSEDKLTHHLILNKITRMKKILENAS